MKSEVGSFVNEGAVGVHKFKKRKKITLNEKVKEHADQLRVSDETLAEQRVVEDDCQCAVDVSENPGVA